MFELANWKNPETLMLNITNSALGIVTIGLLAWVIGGTLREVVIQYRAMHIKH